MVWAWWAERSIRPIDAGESVLFALDLPATGVSYYVQFAQDSDSDGKFGETEVEGYGAVGSGWER